MTEKSKDRIIGISASFITAVTVVFVSFSLNGTRVNAEKLDKRLEEKVDKTVFLNVCKDNESVHEKLTKEIDEQRGSNKQIIDLLREIHGKVERIDERTKK